MEIIIDKFSDLIKIDENLYVVDFDKFHFSRIDTPQARHLNEHWHSVSCLENGISDCERRQIMCSLITTLNMYPFASMYSNASMLIQSLQPKNNLPDRFDNVGAVERVRKFSPGFAVGEFSKINNKNSIPFVTKNKVRWNKIRFLDIHVEKALSYGLLPKNSIFCILKPLQMHIAASISFPGMGRSIFQYKDIKKIWSDLEHSFLTWQILNGILRGCKFMVTAGAANLFSALPAEILYLDEFSDQMTDQSVDIIKKRQLDLYGTTPVIYRGNVKEFVEMHNKSKTNCSVWERPDKGYPHIPKISELIEVIKNPNRKNPNLILPDLLKKEIL